MISDQINYDNAKKFETILREISNHDDSFIRKQLRDKILPLYKEAVENSNGLYDSKSLSYILREINNDEW